MTKLVEQGLFVRPETLGGPVLGTTWLLEAVCEEREIVLCRFELILEEISFGGYGFGLGVGACDVSL